jgi:4a-hydroxytetrahydrobiopterin dehydratase
MTARKGEAALSEAEIARRLSGELPRWRLEGGAIRRNFATHGWKGTLMVVNAIGHLAEAAWHHPDLKVSYASVEVALSTHTAHGVTEKDFALARKIDEMVGWQPAKEAGPLEGTPADAGAAYIKYDG